MLGLFVYSHCVFLKSLCEFKELAVCLHDPTFPTLDSQARAGSAPCHEEISILAQKTFSELRELLLVTLIL